jgi:hypothetical protein
MKRLSVALLAGVAASSFALAGPGYWSSTGPHGGVAYSVVSDPTDNSLLYAMTRGGVFRSVDGGDNWLDANDGFGIPALGPLPIVVDGDRPQDVYTFDLYSRLFRSTDRAENWSSTGFQLDPGIWPTGLVDVPGSQGELWLLVADFTDGMTDPPLLRSVDAGASFVPFGTGLPSGRAAQAVAFDPLDADHVLLVLGVARSAFIAAGDPFPPSVYRSTDGGASWTLVHTPPAGPGGVGFRSGSVSFGAGNRVYATSFDRLLRSDDRGASWIEVAGLDAHQQVVAHPAVADTLWIHDGSNMRMSVDGGTIIGTASVGLTTNPSYGHAGSGVPIGVAIRSLWAEPGFPGPDRRLWIASEGGGLFRSADGSTWAAANDGLAAVNIRSVAVNPHPNTASASHGLSIYAGFGDTFLSSPALYRTSGSSSLLWQPRNNLLRAAQIRGLAIDPTTARLGDSVSAATIYASGMGSGSSGYRNTGLYKSSNSGASWTTLQNGLPLVTQDGATFSNIGTIRAVVLDPRSCAIEPRPPLDACAALPATAGTAPLQRVYATASGVAAFAAGITTFSHRVIASNDAGANWFALDGNPGFPASWQGNVEHEGETYLVSRSMVPVPLVVSASDPDLLYVGISSNVFCSDPGSLPCSATVAAAISDPPTGVVRSTDRGATWTVVSTGLPRVPGYANLVPSALSLVMHPTNHDVLWVSMSDLSAETPAARPTPLFKTTDGGASWFAASSGIPHGTDIRALAVDPDDGNIVYAAGSGTAADPGSVYRSLDGGASWSSISVGLPAGSALALAVDPHNATVLHAGTNSGVWSMEQVPDGDGDGIPDAIENFAPNGGDGNGDGTPDGSQGQVGSTIIILNRPGSLEELKEAAGRNASSGYVTTEIVGGTGVCAQAVDVQNRIAARYGRDYLPGQQRFYRYPRDLVQFEVLDCASVTVDIIFHNADFAAQHGWTMRFHGPSEPGIDDSIGWHDINSRAQRVGSNRWRLTLEANQFGSYRPVDNRILFLGGPACYDDRVFHNGGFEAAPTGLPSCN